MKILLKQILFIFIFSSVLLFSQFGGGNGTKENPYRIYTKADMDTLANYVNKTSILANHNWSWRKYFILMNDIPISMTTPIGIDVLHSFQGNFDGQGHKIPLAINGLATAGLFAHVRVAGDTIEIKNIIVDGIISTNLDDHLYCRIGGIVGYLGYDMNRDTGLLVIKNCINAANIKVVGNNIYHYQPISGIIGSCNNYDTLGNRYTTIIENCINIGKIEVETADNNTASGITREQRVLKNCINAGYIKGGYATGISSFNTNPQPYLYPTHINLTNCINTGVIKGTKKQGGIFTTYP